MKTNEFNQKMKKSKKGKENKIKIKWLMSIKLSHLLDRKNENVLIQSLVKKIERLN